MTILIIINEFSFTILHQHSYPQHIIPNNNTQRSHPPPSSLLPPALSPQHSHPHSAPSTFAHRTTILPPAKLLLQHFNSQDPHISPLAIPLSALPPSASHSHQFHTPSAPTPQHSNPISSHPQHHTQ